MRKNDREKSFYFVVLLKHPNTPFQRPNIPFEGSWVGHTDEIKSLHQSGRIEKLWGIN